MSEVNIINLENVVVLPNSFRNFSGKETEYNEAGKRYFNISFNNQEIVDYLTNIGLPIKYTKPNPDHPDYIPSPFLKINVGYHNNPSQKNMDPRIYLINEGSNDRTLLDKDIVGTLDYARIIYANVTINISNWTKGKRSGVTAYLREAYFVIGKNTYSSSFGTVDYSGFGNKSDDMDELPF